MRETVEDFLSRHFEVESLSKIPTRQTPGITDAPLIWRYFVYPLPRKLHDAQLDEREYVMRCVMKINAHIDGAYVFSSGKNMGVFKAVGYPEDVGRFYKLEEYEGYCWTAHGRYPTNTPAGGAARIRLHCWTIPSYITVRFPPTTQTAAVWKCTVTAAT